jgi:hypothetical protein
MPMVWFLMALGAAAPAAAQAGTEPRIWADVSTQGRFEAGSAWRWTADSIVRAREGAGALDFLAEQLIVTRDLTRRSSVGVGYGYAAGFPDAGVLLEHRFVQQYAWSGGVRRRVSLRSRVEERFVSGQRAMLLRARPQVRVTWPLGARRGLRGVVSDELFVQTSSATPASWWLDNNWVFVGIARTLSPRNAAEIGYMNVYAPGASGNRTSHVMSVTFVVAL